MRQGFYVNADNCIGCRACQVACKDKNDLEVGYLFRRVNTFEVRTYPDSRVYNFASTCNHCEMPQCVASCPSGAMFIDEEDGTVQHKDDVCIGCQSCTSSCPYGVPVYFEDLNISKKCDACIHLREKGEQPVCVAACPMRALEFGPIDELRAYHPEAVDEIAVLPEPTTGPSLAVNPKDAAFEDGYRLLII